MIGSGPKTFEYPVEGLRGIAALMVLYCHLLAPEIALDPGYAPSDLFWRIETGHAAVLFFFVLSGYVIGLTNPSAKWSKSAAGSYLWRRFVRLYPMYFLAVMLGFAVRPLDSWGALLGNLLFLQNAQPYGSWHVPLLQGNTNLWSLNYEVLYYGLFLGLWCFRPLIWVALVGSFAITAAYHFGAPIPAFLMSYAAGWLFWIAGLCLAWFAPKGGETAPSRHPWLSYFLLFIATSKMYPVMNILGRFGVHGQAADWVTFNKLDFIPICVVCIAAASGRKAWWVTLARAAAIGLPSLIVLWRIQNGTFLGTDWLVVPELLTIAAVLLLWCKTSNEVLAKLAWVGGISYGIYVFQRPVQWFLLDYVSVLSGTWWTFGLRFIVAVAVTFLVAWLVEKKLQPKIRRWLSGRWSPGWRDSRPELRRAASRRF